MSVDRLAEAPDQRPQSTRSNPLPRSSTLTHPPLPNNLSEAHAQHTIGSDMDEDEAEAGSILIALANQSGHTKPAPGTSSELGKDLHHHHHQTSKRETENTMRRSSMSIRSLIDVGTTWPPDPPMALDKQQRDADQEARWGSLAAASHRTDQSDGYRDPSDARYQNIHQHAYEHGAHYAVGTSTGNSHHPSEYFHGQKTNFQGVPQTLRPSHPSESSRAPHPTNPPGYQSRQGWTLPRKSENAASGKNPVDVRQHRLLLTPKIRRNALHAYISYLIYADIAAVNKRQRSKYDHSTSVFKSIDRGQSVLQAKAPPLPLPSHPGTQYQQQRQGPHPAQAGVARSYSTPMYSSAPSTIRPVTSSSSYLQPVQPNYYYSAGPESTTAAALPFAPPPPTSSSNRETPVAYYPNEIPNHRYQPEDGHPQQQQRRPEGNIIHRPLTAFLHGDESQSERK